jgi:hypothetical protein
MLPTDFSILMHINDTVKHVQQEDFVMNDQTISIHEIQSSGKLSFSITLINSKKEQYMKDYNINIKGDDNLQIILKEVIRMFIKSFMNSVKDIG